MISDAPPHGIGESGDGFPEGCPDGRDPLEIAREMVKAKILIYSVWCGQVSGSSISPAFFKAIADITEGKYLGGKVHSFLFPFFFCLSVYYKYYAKNHFMAFIEKKKGELE